MGKEGGDVFFDRNDASGSSRLDRGWMELVVLIHVFFFLFDTSLTIRDTEKVSKETGGEGYYLELRAVGLS